MQSDCFKVGCQFVSGALQFISQRPDLRPEPATNRAKPSQTKPNQVESRRVESRRWLVAGSVWQPSARVVGLAARLLVSIIYYKLSAFIWGQIIHSQSERVAPSAANLAPSRNTTDAAANCSNSDCELPGISARLAGSTCEQRKRAASPNAGAPSGAPSDAYSRSRAL